MDITRGLLGAKLDGQAAVADQLLHAPQIADIITRLADELRHAETLPACRALEAHASNVYFGAWAGTVTCRFSDRDQPRMPDHWEPFAVRRSPINRGKATSSAADPINAAQLQLRARRSRMPPRCPRRRPRSRSRRRMVAKATGT